MPICLRQNKMSCTVPCVLFRPHQLHSKASCSHSSSSNLKRQNRSLVMLCLASSYSFATTFVATEKLFEALVKTSSILLKRVETWRQLRRWCASTETDEGVNKTWTRVKNDATEKPDIADFVTGLHAQQRWILSPYIINVSRHSWKMAVEFVEKIAKN